jgi:hypothetical protein
MRMFADKLEVNFTFLDKKKLVTSTDMFFHMIIDN